jgi:hypothetical protein
LVFRFWSVLLVTLGIRKRRSPWGTVYDSVTKQPLDPAYVVLQDQSGKEVGDAITDLDGRYGFLITSGSYQILASKTNYSFPSKKLEGRSNDELYDNLYFGENVLFDTNNVVIKNIPMDPVKFDWNEYAKRDQKLMMFYTKHSRIISLVSTILFRVGFASSIALFVSKPDNFNLIVLIIYGAIFLLHLFGFKPKTSGVITDSNTKKPLSFSIVRIYREGVKEEFTHRVVDQYGRYYCLVPKGEYYVTIEKKNPDETYTLVYTSGILDAKKGILNEEFEV